MKDCTICKPHETKENRALVSAGHTPNFHCTKKEVYRLSSYAAYFYVQTVLDSSIDNQTIHFYVQCNT
jgi:hypothetical protein